MSNLSDMYWLYIDPLTYSEFWLYCRWSNHFIYVKFVPYANFQMVFYGEKLQWSCYVYYLSHRISELKLGGVGWGRSDIENLSYLVKFTTAHPEAYWNIVTKLHIEIKKNIEILIDGGDNH